jgi:GNAT superfamily N-acetyltransferase
VSPLSSPPPFVELALPADERAQIESQLSAAFGLTADAARRWVETTAQHGACFGRREGDVIAASFAGEALALARSEERLTAVMLQSCYVHPAFRGRGYGLERSDVDALRRRFRASSVVLTLFDDALIPYWRRRGFDVVQRAEVIGLDECVRRAGHLFSPVLAPVAAAAKIAEVEAEGAIVGRLGDHAAPDAATILIRYPGDDVVDEVILRTAPGPKACSGVDVRLKTVMASPPGLALVCPIDL